MVSDGTQKSTSSNKKASNNTTAGKLVEVKTGLKNKTLIEITSGVTEGQVVMTELSESTSTSTKSSKSKTSQSGGMQVAESGGPPGM